MRRLFLAALFLASIGSAAERRSIFQWLGQALGLDPSSYSKVSSRRGGTLPIEEPLRIGNQLVRYEAGKETILFVREGLYSPEAIGSHGIAVLRWVPGDANKVATELWIVSVMGGEPRRLEVKQRLAGILGYTQAPDRLLVVESRAKWAEATKPQQIWELDLATEEMRLLPTPPELDPTTQLQTLPRRGQFLGDRCLSDTPSDPSEVRVARLVEGVEDVRWIPFGEDDPAASILRDHASRFDPTWLGEGSISYLKKVEKSP